MHDSQVSASKVITAVLWVWTGAILAAAWTVWVFDQKDLSAMFGFTACASSAVAATSQIRCYTLRVCGLLRVVHGLDESAPPVPAPRSLR